METSAKPSLKQRLQNSVGRPSSKAAVRRTFLGPSAIFLLALTLFPLLFALSITFTNMRLLSTGATEFVGLENWRRLFSDNNFHTVLRNTFIFVFSAVSLQYVLGLSLAMLLNQRIRGRRFFRVSLLLPMMMSPVAISYVIGKMMFSESFGPINDLLVRAGLPPFTWTLDATNSMIVLILVSTWQWTPLFILILLAGLQSIPLELYEAARVDGATSWQIFRGITFPMLLPMSVTAILLRMFEAFKVLDIVRVVTGGGPGNSTETVTLFAYDIGLKGGDIAYASTVAFAFMILVIITSLSFLAAGRRVTPSR